MISRIAVIVLAVGMLAGCPKSDTTPNKAKSKGTNPVQPTKDNSSDVAFQGFVGRLRTAVDRRDTDMLAAMMTRDFGYRWDNVPEGETPFSYWEKHNLWGELAALLRDHWVPNEGFMVVPPQFAGNPEFKGYRAGIRMENGNWRFAYFVSPPPEQQ